MNPANLTFIHRYLPVPVAAGGPSLLLLHGTGGDEDSLLSLRDALAPGAAALSPRGKVLENGMPRFFRRLAEGVLDEADLRLRTAELADFVDDAAGIYGLDRARLYAVGYSNGANIAASMLLLRPGTVAGAVLLQPMVPLRPETPTNLAGTPVFVAGGRRDPIVPPAQTEELVTLLRSSGADVQLYWHPGGHELGGDLLAARDWLAGLTRRPAR